MLGGKRIRATVVALAAWLGACPAAADLIGHGGMVRAIDFSRDGRQIVTGSFDFSAIVWDFEDQREIATLDGHAGPVTSVAFTPDGRVVTAGDDWKVLVWSLRDGGAAVEWHLDGHKHKVMGVDVSPDGRLAVSGGWDKTVRVWDLSTGKQLRAIEVSSPINTVTFIGDGESIAAGGHDSRIRLLATATGRSLGIMEGHQMGITQLVASDDGRQLLSASIDKTVRLWNLTDQEAKHVLESHENQVFGARFLPDGRSAVSTGRDGRIIQWNLNTGKVIRAIQAHDAIAWAVAVSPDGRFVVSGSSDDTARVWHLATGDRIGEAPEVDNAPKPWLKSDHPGAELFKKCARCHALSAESRRRSGPHFDGLFGRRAGSVPGYRYSDALTDLKLIWNEKTLFDLFDQGPDKFLPGTKMPVQKVPDRKKLTQLVDYLKELTAPQTQN